MCSASMKEAAALRRSFVFSSKHRILKPLSPDTGLFRLFPFFSPWRAVNPPLSQKRKIPRKILSVRCEAVFIEIICHNDKD